MNDQPTVTRPRPSAAAASAAAPRRADPTPRAPLRRRTSAAFDHTDGRARITWLIVDMVALAAMAALLWLAFAPTYGPGWLVVTIAGGTVIGLALGLAAARLHWNAAVTAGVGVIAWFLFGSFLAMPSAASARVIPSLRSLHGLATGPVTAPKAMLTLDPPIGETANLLTVPLLIAMVSAVAGVSIALRTRRPALAWIPGSLAIVVAWALGTSTTYQPLIAALGLVAVVVVWTSYRRAQQRGTLLSQRAGLSQRGRLNLLPWAIGAAVLALVAGGTAALAPALAGDQARQVLRHQVQQPLEINQYGSPLQAMRGVLTMGQDEVMFTISGAPANSTIRVATMDTYDGLTYNVTNSTSPVAGMGAFKRVGASVPASQPGTEATVTINVNDLNTVWVPTVGQTTSISFEGNREVALADSFYLNRVTGTGVSTAGLVTGDSYTMTAVVPSRPSDQQIAAARAGVFPQQQVTVVPDSLKVLSDGWTTEAATDGAAALAMEKQFKTTGYFSHGLDKQTPSLSGHSFARVSALIDNPAEMVGDEEQYAVAMALMARGRGIPARVVYGFRAPESGSGPVRGRDVGAWPELFFQGLGWVSFDPTPPQDRVLVKPSEQNPPRPRPHVDNPPPLPKKPQKAPPDTNLPIDEGQPPPQDPPIDWKRIGTVLALGGLPAVALIGPIVLIIGLKLRRRRHRRHDAVLPNRVAGAWAELVDRARDLKHPSHPTATRSEQAEAMVVAFPKMIEQADPIGLAKRADNVVFAPETLNEDQAEAYWATVKAAETGLRKSVSPWAWIKSALSTRSFRKYK